MINYKRIIKSRSVRLRILRILAFIPDKTMLKIQYLIKMGRFLNLKNPRRFTEKIQWYKLYYKEPNMIRCVDKCDVRTYVEEKGLCSILIPCLGVFDSTATIDWDSLPDAFVMKDTLGGGGNSVVIIRNKNKVDREKVLKTADEWTKKKNNIRGGGREWPYYSGKKHRIIIEELLQSDDKNGLIDYKFLCFSGRAEYMQYLADRKLGEVELSEGIFDREGRNLGICGLGHKQIDIDSILPNNYIAMREVADKLSEDFPHARIDLFSVNDKVYFGEITFYGASGYKRYSNDSFDYELGSKFRLPCEKTDL